MSEYDAADMQSNSQLHATHGTYQMIYVVQDFNDLGDERPISTLQRLCCAWLEDQYPHQRNFRQQTHESGLGKRASGQKMPGASRRWRLDRIGLRLLPPRRRTMVLAQVWDWPCFALLLSRLLFGSPYAVRLDSYMRHFMVRAFGHNCTWNCVLGFVLRGANLIIAENQRGAPLHRGRHAWPPNLADS